jgi:hypothetical protein
MGKASLDSNSTIYITQVVDCALIDDIAANIIIIIFSFHFFPDDYRPPTFFFFSGGESISFQVKRTGQ